MNYILEQFWLLENFFQRKINIRDFNILRNAISYVDIFYNTTISYKFIY